MVFLKDGAVSQFKITGNLFPSVSLKVGAVSQFKNTLNRVVNPMCGLRASVSMFSQRFSRELSYK